MSPALLRASLIGLALSAAATAAAAQETVHFTSLDGATNLIYRAWARALVVQGYVALVVDSATPRGFGQTCTRGSENTVMNRDRPRDAFAALQYLQAQPFVQADRIG